MIDGIKSRLIDAQEKKEYIQITFKYPDYERRIFKKGYVTKVFNDSFNFSEIIDGNSTFSFDYIIEIRGGRNE